MKIDKSQALALNAVITHTSEVIHHLVAIEEDTRQIRAGIDADTHIPNMPVHSAAKLMSAIESLKFAEVQAVEHLSTLCTPRYGYQVVKEARARGHRTFSVFFTEGEEVGLTLT